MGEWYDGYVMEMYEERKGAFVGSSRPCQDHERVRRKNKIRLFFLDFGSVQCGEFHKRVLHW
jgi:hypothetical protein